MKAIPSIAFSEFRGTASEVTARQVGGRTVLGGRAQHSHIKSPKQSLRRANFSFITKQFKTLSEEQLRQWASLASAHHERALTGDGTALSAHNLFVCLNSNRALVGVPVTKDAPDSIHGSSYIAYDDIFVTPDRLMIVGLREPESGTSRLMVRMTSADSASRSRSKWSQTVVVGSFGAPDWGDVDMTEVYVREFGVPIMVGRTYYIELYWIDELSGYVSEVTRTAVVASQSSSADGKPYIERRRVTMESVVTDTVSETSAFDFELSPGSKMVSVDLSSKKLEMTYSASLDIQLESEQMENLWGISLYQWARGAADDDQKPYMLSLMEVTMNQYSGGMHMSQRGGLWCPNFESFGTYVAEG